MSESRSRSPCPPQACRALSCLRIPPRCKHSIREPCSRYRSGAAHVRPLALAVVGLVARLFVVARQTGVSATINIRLRAILHRQRNPKEDTPCRLEPAAQSSFERQATQAPSPSRFPPAVVHASPLSTGETPHVLSTSPTQAIACRPANRRPRRTRRTAPRARHLRPLVGVAGYKTQRSKPTGESNQPSHIRRMVLVRLRQVVVTTQPLRFAPWFSRHLRGFYRETRMFASIQYSWEISSLLHC